MYPFDHAPRLSSLSIRRAEQELPPGWARRGGRATVLMPLPRRPHRSSAAAAVLHCAVTAGGRRRALPAPGRGGSLFDHVPRLSSLPIRQAEQEPLRPGWARPGRATALRRSRRPRAGPAGSLRWGRCPAALAVPLPLPLRSTAGGRRRALLAPRGGDVSVRHAPRLSSLPIRRAEQEPLPPGWARRVAALGRGIASVRPRTPTVVAVYSPGRAGAAAPGLGPPGYCAGAAAPPPSPFLCCCCSAPLRVVIDEHCWLLEGDPPC
jgi:hypothetical protein